MVNLNKLRRMVDCALAKETKESLDEWLKSIHREDSCIPADDDEC